MKILTCYYVGGKSELAFLNALNKTYNKGAILFLF